MERIMIDSYVCILLEDEDLRPSIKRKTQDILFSNKIFKVRDVCYWTEADLLGIKGLNKTAIETMKKTLLRHGLRFGMTDQELEDYEDADYYKRHPKEDEQNEESEQEETSEPSLSDLPNEPVESLVQRKRRRMLSTIFNIQKEMGLGKEDTDKETPKKVPLTKALHVKLLNKREENIRNTISRAINERGPMYMRSEDFEFIRFHLFRMSYNNQAWCIRLFCSTRERMLRAKEQSDKLFDEYVKELADETVEAHLKFYDKEISTHWDENWQRYLTDLED